MKKYKPTYCTSIVYLAARGLWSSSIVTPLPFILKAVIHDPEYMGAWGMFISVFWVLGIFSLAVFFISNLIGKRSTKKEIIVNDDRIIYNGKSLFLDEIQNITLYFPEIYKYSHTPQQLSLWIDDKSHMVISRPSLALIHDLRKRCSGAKFEIDDLKKTIKTEIIVDIIMALFLTILLLFM